MYPKTKKIIVAALISSLVCVATMVIKLPSPLKGYLNLGDGIVLITGWILSPWYGFLAAGLGSALADVFSGYAIYAPATFVIKGAMSLAAYVCAKKLRTKLGGLPSHLIGGVLAELIMVVGYYLFEGLLYGFIPSLVNMPANVIQGVAGIIIGTVLITILEKNDIANLTRKQ